MTSFTRDLKRLQSRAFHRADWAEDALRRYHLLAKESTQPVQSLYEWMFVPPTLWPFDVQDLLTNCLTALEKGKRLTEVLPKS